MSLRLALNKTIRRFEQPYDTYNEITISRSALLHNFDLLCGLVPSGTVFPVLKSNAYGHGIAEVATILKDRNFPYIAVDGFYESLVIHEVSKQNVLIMGAILPGNFRRMDFKHCAFVVHDEATIEAIGETGRKVNVHLELDTGMTRHGIAPRELEKYIALIKKYPTIHLEGVMTHLADADNPEKNSFTIAQTKLFDESVARILEAGLKPIYFHIAQSAGSAKVVSRFANAIRPGIALYGINPLEPKDDDYKIFKDLQPVLALYSTISKVSEVSAGKTVSYSRTFTAHESTKIGVLPLGYYEGYKRAFSNTGLVQHKNTYLKVAGRVCMNHTMINLGDSNAKVGSRVTLISNDPSSQASIKNICEMYMLFSYELLVGLSENIRRNIVA